MSCIWISFTLFSNCELNWMRSRKGRKKTNTHCSMKSFGGKVSVFCMMWLWNDPAAAVKFHYPISRDTLSNPRLWLPFTLADDLKCFKDPIFCRLMSIWTASLLCKTGGGLAEQTFDVGADLSQTKNKNACFFPHCWYVLLCKGWTPPPRQLYCIIETTRITWLITPEPAHHTVTTRPFSMPLYCPCERKPDRTRRSVTAFAAQMVTHTCRYEKEPRTRRHTSARATTAPEIREGEKAWRRSPPRLLYRRL